MRSHRFEFAIPPDGEISEDLERAITDYKKSGKPISYLAKMRRLPTAYILHLERELQKRKA